MRVRMLTPAAQILLALARAGRPLTFSEIEEATGLSEASVNLNLKRLMAEGLVERRGRSYAITPSGLAKVESLVSEVTARG